MTQVSTSTFITVHRVALIGYGLYLQFPFLGDCRLMIDKIYTDCRCYYLEGQVTYYYSIELNKLIKIAILLSEYHVCRIMTNEIVYGRG
jgi:hypothetical protein